jgi:hypothetical protein
MYGTGATQAMPLGKQSYDEGLTNQANISPRATPQITARLEELDKATNILHGTIADLENRVQLICRPTPPGGEAAGGKADGPTAPLAMGIRELTDRVRGADMRLRDLINRIEL